MFVRRRHKEISKNVFTNSCNDFISGFSGSHKRSKNAGLIIWSRIRIFLSLGTLIELIYFADRCTHVFHLQIFSSNNSIGNKILNPMSVTRIGKRDAICDVVVVVEKVIEVDILILY